MKPLDFEALYDAIERPSARSRDILFAGLASSKAAWRARAAEGLLKLAGHDPRAHRALTRQFGSDLDAIFAPALDELRSLIGVAKTDAWTAFGASIPQTYDSWHDGLGFNLEALSQMSPPEQNLIRQWLHSRLGDPNREVDLRDLEAAEALGETELLASLARHPNHDVRLRAKELLKDPGDVASELCSTLSRSRSEDDVLRALDLVPSHATPDVRKALVARVKKIRVQDEGARGPLLKELLDRIEKE
jgi:hypothetical protein